MKTDNGNKRVLLLGGTCSIAIDLAGKLIDKGLCPVLTYRNNEGLVKINDQLGSFNSLYETVQFSLNQTDLYEEISNLQCSYLVDFAQSDYESLISSSNESTIENYFTENIINRTQLLKYITRQMLKNKFGRLVFVSSTAALRPNPGQGFYAASKSACEAVYKSIGIELSSRGITSVVIRPGYVDSGRGHEYIKKNDKIKPGFILTVSEISDSILFLLSESAHNINATEIVIDAGLTAVK